jgi:hypothetical protein
VAVIKDSSVLGQGVLGPLNSLCVICVGYKGITDKRLAIKGSERKGERVREREQERQ